MVIINTFKPREFALNDITGNCNYSLGGKERKGVFVVQFFKEKIEPDITNICRITLQGFTFYDMKYSLKIDQRYLPLYFKDQVNNSKGICDELLQDKLIELSSNFDVVSNYYKEEELLYILNHFFELIYNELKKQEYIINIKKDEHLNLCKLDINLKDIKNKTDIFNLIHYFLINIGIPYFNDLTTDYLPEVQNIKDIYINIETLIETVDSNFQNVPNNYISVCLDDFIKFGLLSQIIYRLHFSETNEDLLNITQFIKGIQVLNRNILESDLISCLERQYCKIKKYTLCKKRLKPSDERIKKGTIEYSDMIYFYYDYFIQALENNKRIKPFRENEMELFRPRDMKKSAESRPWFGKGLVAVANNYQKIRQNV